MANVNERKDTRNSSLAVKNGKSSPYSITERRVPELIPVLGSQRAGDVSHKPGGRLPLLSAKPTVTLQPTRGLVPISMLGEQRHDGCEQFAQDCYAKTASRLRHEPRPFCARVQHANHSATEPPFTDSKEFELLCNRYSIVRPR